MKPDQERVKVLLTETIALLCKNGLNFEKDIRVQGLLGITVDSKDVFIVQLNENLWLGEDDSTPSNDNLPVSSPQCAADIAAKSPRRRTGLASRDSPIVATRSVFDEKTSDNSSDAPGSGRAKNRNGKLVDKRHADKSEAIDGASAIENIQNNVRSVDIKTERSTSADEDVVFIDDEDTGGDDAQDDGYDFTETSYDKTRRQSIDEHRLSFDDLNDYERNYAQSPASKRLRRSNSSSEKLFGPSSSTAVLTSRDEAAASSISEANARVKLEIDPDDGPSGSDEQHFQGYDDVYPTYPWDGSDAPSNDYSSALASDILYTFPPNNRSFPSRGTSWFSERKRSSAGQKSSSSPGHRMPLNSLGSRQIRIALVKHLISPAVHIPDHRALAFRIVWRNRLDDVWKNIYHLRIACDELVKNIEGSQFFFSSVTGLISKPQAAGAAIPQDIRPAISYYWVCQRGCKLTDDFVRRVMTELDDAELKPIQSHRPDLDRAPDAFSLATPLFTVLKDYNSSFVLKKIQQSASELYGVGQSPGQVTISKLVIANAELGDLVSQCYVALMNEAPNLYVGLQTTDA